MDTKTAETRGLTAVQRTVAPGGELVLGPEGGADLAVVVTGEGSVAMDGGSCPIGPGDVLQLDWSDASALRATGSADLVLVTLALGGGRPRGGHALEMA